MRKLLILTLVLGMASAANAGMLISVAGDKQPVDSQITLPLNGTIDLDIWTDADIPVFGGEYWALIADTTQASISGGNVAIDPGDAVIYTDPPASGGVPGLPAGKDGPWGGVAVFSGPIAAGTVLYDQITFKCLALVDTTVSLYTSDLGGNNTLVDSVIIHQVPEPMTVALLGLGGLLLRRRK